MAKYEVVLRQYDHDDDFYKIIDKRHESVSGYICFI